MDQSDKQPKTPFEAASYELNKFRERRMADRRFSVRTTPDRRVSAGTGQLAHQAGNSPGIDRTLH